LWSQYIKMLVLIVDSSVQIIDRLEDLLLDAKNITHIHRAVSFTEAKKLFSENTHDAVMLDIDLPENESFVLLKEIKKTAEKTCVIMLSTCMDYYILEHCKSLGADFFFDKYYDFEKICGVIDAMGQISENPQAVTSKNSMTW
jgi:DNA-binding NarL/FixJ family response regulator